MIEDAYVSQDIANRLREKGFTEEPIEGFMPTQQRAMRWLRETKGIFIKIDIDGCGYYQFSVYLNGSLYSKGEDMMVFETYELAVAFGLLYVLTKMDIYEESYP